MNPPIKDDPEAAGGRHGDTLIFLIAGEPSGDALGARLMAALKVQTGGRVRFEGIGGPLMQAEGLDSLFPITDLAVFGVVEVLPRIALILRRIRQTAVAVRRLEPDAVVSIDSPDFCTRVWRRLRGQGIPLIHYVAPTVWAWRPGRARKLAALLDHLLVLLPFEPPVFEKAGLAATFVGHPVIEGGAADGDGPAFRRRHGIDPKAPLVCVLPGSRSGEIRQLLPIFAAAVRLLKGRHDDLAVTIPAVPEMAERIEAACRDWPVAPRIVSGEAEKFDAMAASNAALAASGTVALELALAGVPTVIAYRLHPVTWAVVSRMVRVDYVNIVNLLLGRPAVPELLQDDCNGALLADAVAELLEDGDIRTAQRAAFAEAMALLRPEGGTPSSRAARAVLAVIEERRKQAWRKQT